jgi:hypothetical protein
MREAWACLGTVASPISLAILSLTLGIAGLVIGLVAKHSGW